MRCPRLGAPARAEHRYHSARDRASTCKKNAMPSIGRSCSSRTLVPLGKRSDVYMQEKCDALDWALLLEPNTGTTRQEIGRLHAKKRDTLDWALLLEPNTGT